MTTLARKKGVRQTNKKGYRRRYAPKGPYILSPDSRYPGEALEALMFTQLGYIIRLIRKLREEKVWNNFHKHLEWLWRQGKDRHKYFDTIICPQCGKRPVRWFSVRDGDTDLVYTSCNDPECKGRLIAAGNVELIYVDFSQALKCVCNPDIIGRILRQIFQLPKDLDPNAAFEFFKKDGQLELGLVLPEIEEAKHD